MRHPARGNNSFRSIRGQGAFTLLEILLAVFIIGIIATGVIKAVDTNVKAGAFLNDQVQGTNLVSAYMENMRKLTYNDSSLNPYPTIGSGVTIPSQYTVAVNIFYGSSSDGVNVNWYSTNLSGTLFLQKISVSVSRKSGPPVLTICTFRAKR